jgi:hypothetical protein
VPRPRSQRRRSPWLPPLLLGAGLALAFACGPSVQSIHEGSVRFEHCYRLDLDLDIAPGHREACWKEWLSSYTYGQTRDRIEYARRRIRAFASGDTKRPELGLSGEDHPESRQFYLVVPAPTSLHAPPAPIATRVNGDAGRVEADAAPSADAGKATLPPGEECGDACRHGFESCSQACEADAASSEAVCKSCDPDFKRCMRRCFQ